MLYSNNVKPSHKSVRHKITKTTKIPNSRFYSTDCTYLFGFL